ncbi:hypothetical protein SAY87_005008 [Trapa incisa]|uniref:Fe2OG dioxygenase domain-containing protein n=1 Tax=Trapa incisa TaxID=236973 RepID=A0AAN7JQ70_9MYRT|nr:hypothetical protein SAY87_005008 [Trapa incisa]
MTAYVPVVDLSDDQDEIVNDIRNACTNYGYFKVINHGIRSDVREGALSAGEDFFDLSEDEKMEYLSNDVERPVRYGTGGGNLDGDVRSCREFIKLYANPIEDYIEMWPDEPEGFRRRMRKYAKHVRRLAMTLAEAFTESLDLGSSHLTSQMEDDGMHVITVNGYPANDEPVLSLSAHSDYSIFTILLMNNPGLEVLDRDVDEWMSISECDGLLVLVGDHLEVLSNGRYRGVVHRAFYGGDESRISIASFHSLPLYTKMKPAPALVAEDNKKKYRSSSVQDFLEFLASANNISGGDTYIESLRKY